MWLLLHFGSVFALSFRGFVFGGLGFWCVACFLDCLGLCYVIMFGYWLIIFFVGVVLGLDLLVVMLIDVLGLLVVKLVCFLLLCG